MNDQFTFKLMCFYGVFLIVSGVISVIFIGPKAKTALMSGGLSGLISLLIAYLIATHTRSAEWAGLGLSLALFIVFAWRSTKTLFKIFELLPISHEDLKRKGIAFLIISLMAIVSMVVFILQVSSFQA